LFKFSGTVHELGLFSKTKALEKEQIINAWLAAWKDSMLNPLSDEHYRELAEEYYNETFNTKKI